MNDDEWQTFCSIVAVMAQLTGQRTALDEVLTRWFPAPAQPEDESHTSTSQVVDAIRAAWARWDEETNAVMAKIRPRGTA